MKKTEKISFSLILPCYNVGRYLKKCLDSIYANSRLEGNEIIIVDDGSPDNEIQVCENYFRVKIEGDITRFTYHGTNVIIICKKKWRSIISQELSYGCGQSTLFIVY